MLAPDYRFPYTRFWGRRFRARWTNDFFEEYDMDSKRRINPQNPARKIRGRKQKKALLPRTDLASPVSPASSGESGDK